MKQELIQVEMFSMAMVSIMCFRKKEEIYFKEGRKQQRINHGWSPVSNAHLNTTRGFEQQQQMNLRGQTRTQNFQRASVFSGVRFGGGGNFACGAAHIGGGSFGGGGGHFGAGAETDVRLFCMDPLHVNKIKRSVSWSILRDNYSVLGVRKIRIYMTGQSINLVGDWMQQTAQAWLVWELTHKATSLGIVAFLSQIPFFIFGPWVGFISDRFDRRKILLITQVLTMIFVFVLAILIQTGSVLLWHVYGLAFLFGTVTAFNMTAEQTFIGEIAGEGNIRKAVALNNSVNQLSRFIGPAIAGWLIASFGISPAFWLNGISILVSVICIWIIPGSSGIKKTEGGGLKQFAEGLHFLFHDKLLRLIILFAAMQTFFGLSIVQLLPAVSTLILKGNASTLGALTGAAGAGAFIGTVFALPFVQRIKKSCIAIGGAVIWAGLWYSIFSFSNNLYLSMLCQFMASLGAANVLTLSLALTQELTPVKMRGEMISTFLMIILGLQPFASYLVGKTADKIGVDVMMRINGGLLICLPVILLAIPALNRLKKTIKPVAVTKHVIG